MVKARDLPIFEMSFGGDPTDRNRRLVTTTRVNEIHMMRNCLLFTTSIRPKSYPRMTRTYVMSEPVHVSGSRQTGHNLSLADRDLV